MKKQNNLRKKVYAVISILLLLMMTMSLFSATLSDSTTSTKITSQPGETKQFVAPCDGSIRSFFYDDNAYVRVMPEGESDFRYLAVCDNEMSNKLTVENSCGLNILQHGALVCDRDKNFIASLPANIPVWPIESIGCPSTLKNYNIDVKAGDNLEIWIATWAAGAGWFEFTPDNPEQCGVEPSNCVDSDSDGYDNCNPGENGDDGNDVDCNDGDDSVYPGAEEFCNGVDNNCNGGIDEENVCNTFNVECSYDFDCGINQFIGAPFCSNENVFDYFRTFTCMNPGTVESQCVANNPFADLFDSCEYGCEDSACLFQGECEDGIDNEGDDLIDMEDPDCLDDSGLYKPKNNEDTDDSNSEDCEGSDCDDDSDNDEDNSFNPENYPGYPGDGDFVDNEFMDLDDSSYVFLEESEGKVVSSKAKVDSDGKLPIWIWIMTLLIFVLLIFIVSALLFK